jgi:hypothetical protein
LDEDMRSVAGRPEAQELLQKYRMLLAVLGGERRN